jgi:hypothetical protein
MTDLRNQLESARAAHQQLAYPGDLAAEMLVADEPQRPLVLRIFYAAGVLATAAALTFGVMRFGAMSGTEPDHWRRQLTSLGDRGKALVMSVSSGLPNNWELPSVHLPQMARPSEFPQHLRMMSPLNRVKKPDIELPEKLMPESDDARKTATEHAA